MQTLMVKSANRYRKATVAEVCEVAGQYAIDSLNRSRPILGSTEATVKHLREIYAGRDYETFCVLFLDKRNRLIEAVEMFRGTIDGASVHPREVAKECLWKGAAAVIVAHNHPSGLPSPSRADENITEVLKNALALIDIRVLDHVIIGNGLHFSFAQKGMI